MCQRLQEPCALAQQRLGQLGYAVTRAIHRWVTPALGRRMAIQCGEVGPETSFETHFRGGTAMWTPLFLCVLSVTQALGERVPPIASRCQARFLVFKPSWRPDLRVVPTTVQGRKPERSQCCGLPDWYVKEKGRPIKRLEGAWRSGLLDRSLRTPARSYGRDQYTAPVPVPRLAMPALSAHAAPPGRTSKFTPVAAESSVGGGRAAADSRSVCQ